MFLLRYNDYASSRAKGLGDYNVDRKPLASEDEVQHDSESSGKNAKKVEFKDVLTMFRRS